MKIILASKSPRRKEILENLGIEFSVIVSEADESSEEKNPSELPRILALRKGRAVGEKLIEEEKGDEDIYIISGDTVVATGKENGAAILGKPKDKENAKKMLMALQGKAHYVFSGISITKLSKKNKAKYEIEKEVSATEQTEVVFAKMSEEEIEFYIENENVLDKAGAYAVQGIASAFIERLCGDYFNVVGLPARRLVKLFSDEFGIKPTDIICSKKH